MPHSPETEETEDSRAGEEANKIATGSRSPSTSAPAANPASHAVSHVTNTANGTISTPTLDKVYDEVPQSNRNLSSLLNSEASQKPVQRNENSDKSRATASSISPERRREMKLVSSDSIKVDKEVVQLKEQLAGASPKALQKVLRDKWREFLFEGAGLNHLSFVLRALLKNMPTDVLMRVGDDLVSKTGLLDAATHDRKVMASVLHNAGIEELTEYTTKETIDKLVSYRMKTAPAKTLIRWLAENDRLGYQLDDIIQEGEYVLPNIPGQSEDLTMTDGNHVTSRNESRTGLQNGHQDEPQRPRVDEPPRKNDHLPWSRDPVLANRERERHAEGLRLQSLEYHQMQQGPSSPSIERMKCPSCHYWFFDVSGFNYHVDKKLCRKEPIGYKFSCTRCYQGFSTKQGQEYHCKKEVCANHEPPPIVDLRSRRPRKEVKASAPSVSRQPVSSVLTDSPKLAHQPAQVAVAALTPIPASTGYGPDASHGATRAVLRPPLNTPITGLSRTEPPVGIRQSPSELPPDRRAALDKELAEEDARYSRLIALASSLPAEERQHRLTSLKNGTASKKSQIRKKYGVSLRLREKDRAARLAAAAETPVSDPRTKNSMASPLPTRVSGVEVAATTRFSPINAAQHVSLSPPNGRPYVTPYTSHQAPQRPPIASQQISLRHSQTDLPSDKGFDIFLSDSNDSPRNATHNQKTTSSYVEQQRHGKRRRSEDDEERQPIKSSYYMSADKPRNSLPTPRPKVSMMEVHAEDAASKYPGKPAIPRKRRSRPQNSASPIASSDNVALVSRPPSTNPNMSIAGERRIEPVYISSDDESGSSAEANHLASSQQLLSSIEGTDASTSTSRHTGIKGVSIGTRPRRESSAQQGDTTEDEGSRPGSAGSRTVERT